MDTYQTYIYEHGKRTGALFLLMADEHGTHGHIAINREGDENLELFVWLNSDGTYEIDENPLEEK